MTAVLTWAPPTTEESLIELVVQLLTTPLPPTTSASSSAPPAPLIYPPAAGLKVYAPRDWPTSSPNYPDILVSTPSEQKENPGHGQSQFLVTTTVRLLVRADNPADPQTGGSAGQLQAQLASIKRQIEVTLIGNPALMQTIQRVASVRSEYGYNSGGEKHMGELGIELELEYYQSAWAFYVPAGTAITEVAVATNSEDLGAADGSAHVGPGLDITLPNS